MSWTITPAEVLTLLTIFVGGIWQSATLFARHSALEQRVGALQTAVEQLLGRPVLVHVRERERDASGQ